MTKNFHYLDKEGVSQHLKPRSGETKFGENISCVSSDKELEDHPGQFVIFGIEEDIGIQGNLGKPGAAHTWNAFLNAFLNIQVNRFNSPENSVVLGKLASTSWQRQAKPVLESGNDLSEKLDPIVREIDEEVSELIEKIIRFGKTPVVIGGGHNNVYGNLCGASRAKNAAVNCLNIDAHTDLRQTDFRHSGNGFSFARKHGFLKNYAMMGLHKNYTPEYIFEWMDKEDGVYANFYDDLTGKPALEKSEDFLKLAHRLDAAFGVELDCDGIADFPSSAQSPVGFTLEEIRLFLKESVQFNPHYLHICEAAAVENPQVGKSLSYLVSDFIRQ